MSESPTTEEVYEVLRDFGSARIEVVSEELYDGNVNCSECGRQMEDFGYFYKDVKEVLHELREANLALTGPNFAWEPEDDERTVEEVREILND